MRSNEEPIGPWIKMEDLKQLSLQKNVFSQFIAGKWTFSLVKRSFLFFGKETWPKIKKKSL